MSSWRHLKGNRDCRGGKNVLVNTDSVIDYLSVFMTLNKANQIYIANNVTIAKNYRQHVVPSKHMDSK
jgi:hypothetical protein